jgi:1,4-alpha-glucan branching enzyme
MTIDLDIVGARAAAPTSAGVDASFGIYLPGISQADGYQVLVRIIHQRDRFVPEVPTMDFPLAPVSDDPNGFWRADVHIPVGVGGNSFGLPGTYLYRYRLLRGGSPTTLKVVTSWFTDPFARATDEVGELSAFTTPESVPDFTWGDGAWKVPDLADLVVYELHVEQFNSTFDGVVDRLAYLQGLGVNCLELMPVTSLKLDFDWGYGPLHYLAPNERWGGAGGLKHLVDACHAVDIAVILDVVYQHTDVSFPYSLVYSDANLPSPMMGGFGWFGPMIDYNKAFSRDYVQAVNRYWLHEYHVDGFRYDEVAHMFDGPVGHAYAKMAYDAYNDSLSIPRFTPSGGTAPGEYSRIIQVAEDLDDPRGILRQSYSIAAWQDELLNKAEAMAQFRFVDDAFAHLLDSRFSGYPLTKTVHDRDGRPVDMPVAPFQYVESHDHSQLVAFAGSQLGMPFADRSPWYRLQPFAIALYTCEGIPMLWEGQEVADNYVLPGGGDARVHFRRNLHWEYFYDDEGHPLVRLYRILGRLRHAHPSLRSRDSFYYNTLGMTGNGVIVYRRRSTSPDEIAMVFLNFSDQAQTVFLPFPEPGTYRETIDRDAASPPADIVVEDTTRPQTVEIPSNYGRIYVK